jgi:hypothetical protein
MPDIQILKPKFQTLNPRPRQLVLQQRLELTVAVLQTGVRLAQLSALVCRVYGQGLGSRV